MDIITYLALVANADKGSSIMKQTRNVHQVLCIGVETYTLIMDKSVMMEITNQEMDVRLNANYRMGIYAVYLIAGR